MAEPPRSSPMLAGGCRCGQLRYQLTGAPKFIFACHCTDCQRFSASAFAMGMVVDNGQFALAAGTTREWQKIASSGKPSSNFTCPVCATWTHTRPQSHPSLTIVRPSSLDEHGWMRPNAEIFTRSALPWARLAVQFSYEAEFSDPGPIASAFAQGGIALNGIGA